MSFIHQFLSVSASEYADNAVKVVQAGQAATSSSESTMTFWALLFTVCLILFTIYRYETTRVEHVKEKRIHHKNRKKKK